MTLLDKTNTLVIVPAYNEQDSIVAVIEEIKATGFPFVVIDDGSTDETRKRAIATGAQVISLPFNSGVGGALKCGFRYAVDNQYCAAVQFDSDGQHPSTFIEQLIDQANFSSAELVIGSRFLDPENSLQSNMIHKAAQRFLKRLLNLLLRIHVSDATSGFRLFAEPLLSKFAMDFPRYYLGDTVEALQLAVSDGYRVTEIGAPFSNRLNGKSSASSVNAFFMVLKVIVLVILRSQIRLRRRSESISEEVKRESKSWVLGCSLFMTALTYFVWWRVLPPFGQIPGNIGDARFNIYILENTFQWSTGRASLWSPSMFWPLKGAGSFSELHTGSLVFFAGPRLLGVSKETSMQIWYLCGIFLSLFSAFFAARWLKYSAIASSVIGFIYACALPVTAQSGHAQLIHRWAAPWAIVAVICLSRQVVNKKQYILLFFSAVCLQFLISPGSAVATVWVSVTIWVIFSFSGSKVRTARSVLSTRYLKVATILELSVIVAAMAVAIGYFHFKEIYKISRVPSEIIFFSPTFESLLQVNHSLFWKHLSSTVPGSYETQLFLGSGVFVLLLAGIFSEQFGDKREKLLSSSVALVFLSIAKFGDTSFYMFASNLPGFDSVRTPGRFWLFALFPIALIVGSSVQSLSRRKSLLSVILIVTLMTMTIFETSYINLDRFSKSEFNSRTNEMIERIREKVVVGKTSNANAFLVLDSDQNNGYTLDLDAMLASQEIGLPTINGYSGWDPTGFIPIATCDQANEVFKTLRSFYPDFDESKVVIIGGECD